MGDFINFLGNNLADFWTYTGFANATVGHVVMILVGLGFIYLAVAKEFEPMLLIPIGFFSSSIRSCKSSIVSI